MSVLASKRKESREEAIAYSLELYDMLIEFMQRSFAIKSQEQFVREQYATGKGLEVDYQAYAYIMLSTKEQIEKSASLLTANLRAARSLFPTSMHEYASCLDEVFNKLEYRKIPKSKLTGEKFMEKSVNMGDQLSQAIGIYYPHRIDNYVKYVRGIKFYGRYSDD